MVWVLIRSASQSTHNIFLPWRKKKDINTFGLKKSFLSRAVPIDLQPVKIFFFFFFLSFFFFFFFFFLIWVLWPFEEYFTYIEPIVHQRWTKTGEPGEKSPEHP